ncbi:MATE efflux family protein [Methanococcus vannielii SB]|uniref:Multidrug export protein MepA n=1 Tax=Methanococcus vannielii (strain ATCC 35089 / DSM 1224 / JCM 13029 / OCM 148 / SB) TaxID=406327 RepID=A6USM4_METVS|nr:MATE family efflux transporter [Methanococcus vannielii]ABR55496.1 MATE efflux family protein [Methanococcus vannielii SB]
MKQVYDLGLENINKLLARYLVPSVLGTTIIGIYSIIDGIFIGRYVGTDGLAGVTLAFPISVAVGSIGLMIGYGACANISVKLGKRDFNGANAILSVSLIYILIFGTFITFFGSLLLNNLIEIMNIPKNLESYVLNYSRVIIFGSLATITAYSLDAILRNDGFPKKSMYILIIVSISNIVLDYILIAILNFGVLGAAFATIIAQTLGSLIYLHHFIFGTSNLVFQKNKIHLEYITIVKILKTGFSPFIMELAFGFLMLIHNIQFLRYGSSIDVSAYGIVIYVTSFLYMGYLGISDGIQPLISYNYGAKKFKRVFEVLKKAIFINFLMGIISFILILRYPKKIIHVFNPYDALLVTQTVHGLIIHNFSLLILGISMIIILYFQATENSKIAGFLSLGRSILFIIPALLIFPKYLGVSGIWLSTVFSEYLCLLFGLFFFFRSVKKNIWAKKDI